MFFKHITLTELPRATGCMGRLEVGVSVCLNISLNSIFLCLVENTNFVNLQERELVNGAPMGSFQGNTVS